MARLVYPFVCGLDWLQIYCYLHSELKDYADTDLKVSVKDFPTPQFLMKADVSLRVDGALLPFCQILFKPRTSVLPGRAAQVKIENRALYESNLMPRISYVFSRLDIEYRSLSRVDVYLDCNRYYGGKRPSLLVSEYVKQKILKIGINRGYLNFANYGYMISNGSRKVPAGFHVGSPQWTGITWGSKDYIQTQIYDKTRELREQKYKPYIVDAWQRAGLDISNVWRTEMRIMSRGKGIQLLESGDLFALGAFEIANEARVRDLFLSFAERQLRFVYRDYHAKRQQMRPVKLFNHVADYEVSIKPKICVSKVHSTRTKSMVVNFLDALREYVENNALATTTQGMSEQITNVINQINATFPNYLFNEVSCERAELFRRLNDALLRRVHTAMTPLDLFVSEFLNAQSAS